MPKRLRRDKPLLELWKQTQVSLLGESGTPVIYGGEDVRPPQEALAPAPEEALNHLFFSLVERYEPNTPTHSPDDADRANSKSDKIKLSSERTIR